MSPIAATLPQNTGSGYVAAAYIVFFALVLIYVAIMAIRLGRVERSLRELRTRARATIDDVPERSGMDVAADTAPGEPRELANASTETESTPA